MESVRRPFPGNSSPPTELEQRLKIWMVVGREWFCHETLLALGCLLGMSSWAIVIKTLIRVQKEPKSKLYHLTITIVLLVEVEALPFIVTHIAVGDLVEV